MATLPRRERRVLVVGVGDDGPAGLSPGVLDRVKDAELLVGGRRHQRLFAEVSAERVVVSKDVSRLIDRIEREMATRRVVVLASGDPCFFGIGPLLASRLGRAQVEIVPHVSSVALAFARLGIGWQDARVVSAHGRDLGVAVQAAIGAEKLAVLTDDVNTPSVVAKALLEAGADDADAWVFEHLGGADEREAQTTLAGLSDLTFASLNVLVVPHLTWKDTSVLADQAHSDGLGFGLPESEYAHAAGMITKPEVRAVSLSKLRLRAGAVLWDVGAGSGSLAIEAAGLVPTLTAYAVERSETQLAMLRTNVANREHASCVHIVPGEAPDALAALPDPDAVFVGGSGGHLLEILDAARTRLRAGGRIVVNLVTYEHVAEVLAWAGAHQVTTELVQIGVARGSDILGLTRLQSENPVTVVTLLP